jgi:hypothetical protein
MPLPVGTWNIAAGGATQTNSGTLVVSSVESGSVVGTVFGDPMTGFFDEASQRFRLMRTVAGVPPVIETYEGALFQTEVFENFNNLSGPNGTLQIITFTLAGDWKSFAALGAVADNSWTWVATTTQYVGNFDGDGVAG